MEVDRLDVVDAGRDPRPDQQLDRDAGAGRVGADVGVRLARASARTCRRRRARARHGSSTSRPCAAERNSSLRSAMPAAPGASARAPRRRPRCLPDRHRSSCRSRRRRRRRRHARFALAQAGNGAADESPQRPMGICVLMRTVDAAGAVVESTRATERGSIVSATTRWLTRSSATTAPALAKAASAGLGVCRGASRRRCCRGPRRTAAARRRRVAPGGRPPPAIPRSRPSPPRPRRAPASRVSATTAATGSPTKRARSCASARRGGVAVGRPSARLKPAVAGIGLTPAAARSAPVIDGEHARHGCGRIGVDRRRCAACAYGERRKAISRLRRQRDVVGDSGRAPRSRPASSSAPDGAGRCRSAWDSFQMSP